MKRDRLEIFFGIAIVGGVIFGVLSSLGLLVLIGLGVVWLAQHV